LPELTALAVERLFREGWFMSAEDRRV